MTNERRRGRAAARWVALAAAVAVLPAVCGAGAARASTAAGRPVASQPPNILAAPTRVVRTAAGDVGYREIGHGSTVLLINGRGTSMDAWAPTFVDALAAHHRVVVFDNAGVGATAPLPSTTVPAMAEQTSALISALHLGRPTVLGWSLGGMIAQALAVRHPGQVGRLVLAATQAGDGRSLPIPAAAAAALASGNPAEVLSVLFPADQLAAGVAYGKSIQAYPDYYQAPLAVDTAQDQAIATWMAGDDPVGHAIGWLRVPTLVADGTQDALDPSANDALLARSIRGAHLVLYPDAGHAFLFQDTASFVPAIDAFIASTGRR